MLGERLWQPSQGHLLANFIPNSPFAFLTPSPLLPFQPPDLNSVHRGGSLALNVHKNTTDVSTHT